MIKIQTPPVQSSAVRLYLLRYARTSGGWDQRRHVTAEMMRKVLYTGNLPGGEIKSVFEGADAKSFVPKSEPGTPHLLIGPWSICPPTAL